MKMDVNIMYDSGISKEEARAIIVGIEQIMEIFPGRQFINYENKPWSRGDYSSADWYVRHASVLSRSGKVQLVADSILNLLNREPWQKMSPHIDVFFVSRDLTAEAGNGRFLNFCFGKAQGRATVQSVARFRYLESDKKFLAIKTLVQHELGHIFGLAANPERSNTEYIFGNHCTNPGCVMRQALTAGDWTRNALESWRNEMIYCPQCMEDARRTKI